MAALLVDTDVLVDYLRDHPKAVRYLERCEDHLFVSAITVAELYAGVREGKEREKMTRFLRAFEILPVDASLAMQGGLFRRDFGRTHGVGLADALIAATAIQRGIPLVTLNQKHFPMLSNTIVPYGKISL
ncbi:MAG: type II toxin-antitoxin system VapC family toxin [Candidatus Sumerlaeia bacterium]|nr:type II toxin-antitoxin system VapC family toxin [Candidatus Sumerlaeia bacterium]